MTGFQKYYGMRHVDDVTVAFIYSLRRHCGGLNFNRIFSKFLSEVYKIRGMSGIAFEPDPLIFTVYGMKSSCRHFGFSLKLVEILNEHIFSNALDLLITNPVLFFACDEPLPVKSCSNLVFKFSSKLVKIEK